VLSFRVRRLIVNADDFGLTAGVNRAIIEAHTQGIVTSTTLMANSAAFDDAVEHSRPHPNLDVGCHLMLVDGEPLLPAGNVPSLIARQGSTQFLRDISSFALRALGGRLKEKEIEAEATAQIRRLQSAGIQVSHIDTHKHTHLFPAVLRPVLKAAQACRVRAIRNPFGQMAFRLVASRPALWKRYTQLRALETLARRFRKTVADAEMITTDGSLGVVATGALDDRLLHTVLETLPEGTWELVTHPGYNDADLGRVHTRLRESREAELRILTSPATRELLQRNNIQLLSYGNLHFV